MLRSLFSDLKFKVLSVVLGFGTWWIISQGLPKGPSDTRDFKGIPVHVMSSWKIRNSAQLSPDKISVKLRGPSSILQDISPSQITAYVRISETQSGAHSVLPAIFLSPELVKEGVAVEEVPRVRVDISPQSE